MSPSVANPWAKHYQLPWENRANDRNLPLWLRVACLAYARHEANGHANFRRGQLSWILGTPPTGDKPFERVPRQRVIEAINRAIKFEWLDSESCTECLVVPGHAVQGGLGNPDRLCPVHERKRERRRERRHTARLHVVETGCPDDAM